MPLPGTCLPFTLQKAGGTNSLPTRFAAETAQKRAQAEQCAFDADVPGLVDVTDESHENPANHPHVIFIDDVTHELMACTYPHHVHRNAFCKHMAAVEIETDDGTH
ncbi:hypothetical protein [Haladaptatus sp. T7]|uniref:hypothetical protein n=1 Tax=Haladaptatus sp. T7 TaxID=2029368 RepID=UPI0021A25539|nr:hypothetical protein [Haladaptatus sp. T7]GKZ15180.1 hypothetical protein HAL_30610 [Haladaptatus sp. T7]